jgi:hypothetical protein
MMQSEVATLDFHGDGVSLVTNSDGMWLVLGQLTANLGLDAQAQQRALERSAWSRGKTAITAVMLPGDLARLLPWRVRSTGVGAQGPAR